MLKTNFGEPHKRVSPESFYTNSWPECFCQISAQNSADKCPPNDILNIMNDELQKTETDTNSTISWAKLCGIGLMVLQLCSNELLWAKAKRNEVLLLELQICRWSFLSQMIYFAEGMMWLDIENSRCWLVYLHSLASCRQ